MQTQSGAIVNKLLTTASNGYFPTGFIAERILPAVYVPQTTGLIGKYSNNHLRIVNTAHVGKGNYRRLESVTTSSDVYSIEDHGLEDIITENDMRNFETPFDAETDTTISLTLAHLLAKEYGLATTLQNPSIITQGVTLSGTAQYNNLDHADSDPLGDKIAADNAIEAAVGGPSNTAIMSMRTFRYLARHKQILGAYGFQGTPPMGLSAQQLATVLQVDQVLVSDVSYNTAKEGQADVLANIWGKDVIYARIFAPALRQKTLGYEMRKSGTQPREVRTYTPVMPVNSRGVIVTDNYDQLILNPTCAYLIQDAVA
jgi:hypothetical protein